MHRHWKRPWISLLVLAAVAASLLAWPAPASRAQTTTYPGQSDPIGTRAGALTQFPDDELVTLNDADSADYQLVGYLPNGDYTLPAAVDAQYLEYRPTGQVPFADAGYQHLNVTAKGRIVVPTRDVALTLSKTAVDTTSQTMTWVLQEMSFNTPGSSLPKTVPSHAWTSQVQNSPYYTDSPGALAIGDVDRTLTPDPTYGATYNDEAVVAYEAVDSTSNTSHIQLDVVSYVAQPDRATVTASATTTATSTGTFAYLCNLSSIAAGGCVQHPGNIEVTMGDMDGDGYEDIVLVATMYQAQNNAMVLQSYVYSYCPAALASTDPRVTTGICTAGASSPTLALRATAAVNATANVIQDWAMFQAPVDLAVGDYDGDGGLELAVLHQTYQTYTDITIPGGGGTYKFARADVTLSIVQWTGAAKTPWQKVFTNEGDGQQDGTLVTNSWDDGAAGSPQFYQDMHLAAGLFKFSPELGYDLNRRQLAVAWPLAGDSARYQRTILQIELWDLASPNSPGKNRPSEWTLNRYDSTPDAKAIFCYGGSQQSYAPFGLVAGNWAGVNADPTSPLWGVGVAYEAQVNQGDPTQLRTQIWRVDQNIDPTTANGPLTLAATTTLPKLDSGGCGTSGRVELTSLDLDGDAIRLGAPMHLVVEVPNQYDWILQEPPQHIDYFPNGGLTNVSRSEGFDVLYTDEQGQADSVTTGTSSDWTVGTSVKANGTVGVDGDYAIAAVNASVSVTNQFNYDYDNNQATYNSASTTITSTLSAQTNGDDSLSIRSRIFDIWRYPAYGVASTNPGEPYAYYELYLPRPNQTSPVATNGLAAQNTSAYQPPHENGNVLSYPAVARGETWRPPDVGQTILSDKYNSNNAPANAVLCENNTRYCVDNPLTSAGQQLTWGGNQYAQQLQVDQFTSTTSRTAWSNKVSDSLDVEATSKFTVFGAGSSGCANIQVHGGYSWGQSSTFVSSMDDTQTLQISVPGSNAGIGYAFNPMLYVTDNGTLKASHGVFIDTSQASWWTDRYAGADPALNLPHKFYQPAGSQTWEVNKSWLDARQLRGFWVRSATRNPISQTYDVVEGEGVKAGEQVLLDARVYNYSVGTPVVSGTLPIRFDLEPIESATNNQASGPRFTAGTVSAGAIPYHGQEDSSGTTLPNYTSVSYPLDTSTLRLPAGKQSQTYRVWVVLDGDDPANTANQTHGWRQPNVIVTPAKTLQAGTTATVQLQDASGTVLDTVSYTSTGTDDNIAVGLMNALNASLVLQQFGAKANMQDTGTSTPSVVVYKGGATPPAGTEFRAGIVSGSDALYVVPPAPTSGTPLVTATNLQYGQNNEGWGLLTVYKSATPGPMLGADDPCALGSGFTAARGPDVQLRRTSLTPLPAGARVAGGKTVVRSGDRVPIRVSAYAGTSWAGFERVTVYQGEPEQGGTVAGTALIRGIDARTGGHGWFTWRAPTQPGTYTLVARLQEHHNDAAPGNNEATVEIVVEAGPQLPYRRFLGAISKGAN